MSGYPTNQALEIEAQLRENHQRILSYNDLYVQAYQAQDEARAAAIAAHVEELIAESKTMTTQLEQANAMLGTEDGWIFPHERVN